MRDNLQTTDEQVWAKIKLFDGKAFGMGALWQDTPTRAELAASQP